MFLMGKVGGGSGRALQGHRERRLTAHSRGCHCRLCPPASPSRDAFPSLEVSKMPRKHWSSGRRAKNARRPRKPAGEPSPQNTPSLFYHLGHHGSQTSVSGGTSPTTPALYIQLPTHFHGVSTRHPLLAMAKGSSLSSSNLHSSLSFGCSGQKPVIILELRKSTTLPPKNCIQNLPTSPPPGPAPCVRICSQRNSVNT